MQQAHFWIFLGALVALTSDTVLSGQQPLALEVPSFEGPPPPVSPEVLARDGQGRVTLRAVRVDRPLEIDGRLDEAFYTAVRSMSGFTQVEPIANAPATEKTEIWLAFDDQNVYVAFRCWETEPDRVIASEMRRDSVNLIQRNDNIAFMFDTFYDRRNSFLFEVNAIAGRWDGQVADERSVNSDWNTIWEVRAGRFDDGWTLEAAIPFKSLRYRAGQNQVWGFNVRRFSRWKNEVSYLSPTPVSLGMRGIFQASSAATVVGIETPVSSRNLELKPYAVTDLTSDVNATPRIRNELAADVGLDVKYGVTQSLTADITVNTDFAQVEADTQQVNLTRFSLFFPEKREFFLENQGTFAFGGTNPTGAQAAASDAPVLFYSRRIGLDDGRTVPIEVGGRLTGKLGAFSVGAMNIQTGSATPSRPTNFTVMRIKRDILRRSSIGAIFTGRSVSTRSPTGTSEAYGIDGIFAFYDNLTINTYWATTRAPGLDDDAVSYRTHLDYNADRYGLQLARLIVGNDFNPEVGFARRLAFERTFGSARFSPRPQSIDAIRKLFWDGRVDYITDREGVLESREVWGQFGIEFETSDRLDVAYTRQYERLTEPFRIDQQVTIPTGSYSFQDVRGAIAIGNQRRLSGTFAVQHGSFFSGDKTSVGFTGARLEVTPQFSLEPSVSWNRVDLPEGNFTTQVVTARATYTVTPLMFVSALLQYNSSGDALSTNLRLRWEYVPGSELFVVYNEQRDTLARSFPDIENRVLIVKINRLFRF